MNNLNTFYTTDNNYSVMNDEQLIELIQSGDKYAIDFLIENNGEVIPLEIKSGKNYKKHNALDNLLTKDFDIHKAYIFSNNNIEVHENKIYLPIYMIMFLKKEQLNDTLYKIDLSNL